jgi:hypothetical protein
MFGDLGLYYGLSLTYFCKICRAKDWISAGWASESDMLDEKLGWLNIGNVDIYAGGKDLYDRLGTGNLAQAQRNGKAFLGESR